MKKYNIFLFFIVLAQCHSSFAMQRSVGQLGLVATALQFSQKRFLSDKHINHPLWIKADTAVKQFYEKHNMVEISSDELKMLSNKKDEIGWWIFNNQLHSWWRPHNQHRLQEWVDRVVKPLITKHELDSREIKIYVGSNSTLSGDKGVACAFGNTVAFCKELLDMPPDFQTATVEHELGHLYNHDSSYTDKYKSKLNENQMKEFSFLKERRADMYSALQSENNLKALMEHTLYAIDFKYFEIAQCQKDQTLDPKEKKKKLKELYNKPTYLEELFAYMNNKK